MDTLSRLNKDILNPLANGNYGVLDNIVKDLIKQGLIVKTGRGLIT